MSGMLKEIKSNECLHKIYLIHNYMSCQFRSTVCLIFCYAMDKSSTNWIYLKQNDALIFIARFTLIWYACYWPPY